MKRAIILALLLIPFKGWSQCTVQGTITDGTDGKILPYASIYIPELMKGVAANQQGLYRINQLPKGTLSLEVKCLGYEAEIVKVKLTDSLTVINIKLQRSFYEYPEFVVYGHMNSKPEETANTITSISAEEMRENGSLSLSDAISKLPGVSQLNTGPGISKPVIRGLFGNRVQTVLLGLRFDNQQWQDEHGLGLSDAGVERVEIIKGPSSLLYGSEAMGGVLNVIEEEPAPVGQLKADYSVRLFSNTYGIATDAGVKKSTDKFFWRIRLGGESHADYTDGNNKRIVNSRWDGYYFKGTVGFKRKNWVSANNYYFGINHFGFIMDAFTTIVADDRMSRSFEQPHHSVLVNVFSSQNNFFLRHSKLKVNFGAHLNNRQEQEGGSRISLDMQLNTYIANATWSKNLSDKTEFSLGTQDFFQTNKNNGSRIIVPDAQQFESSLFSYLKSSVGKNLVLEGGVRYDMKNITTLVTPGLNTDISGPGSAVTPFDHWYSSLNGSIGMSLANDDAKSSVDQHIRRKSRWNLKANLSSGYRSPNLAELSSNGLHEGTVRWEIGNIDLKVEQNFCADIFVGFESKSAGFNVSAYQNTFRNYIFLAPTNDEYIGFKIYRYMQTDAYIRGIETSVDIHPAKLKWLDWSSSYSYILGKTFSGDNLPFIPAPRIKSDVKFTKRTEGKVDHLFFKPGIVYCFKQDRPFAPDTVGQFETPTDAYFLLNASCGLEIKNKHNSMIISLSGNNLLNNAYYDHLSRYKYFGIYNMGMNYNLNFKMTF